MIAEKNKEIPDTNIPVDAPIEFHPLKKVEIEGPYSILEMHEFENELQNAMGANVFFTPKCRNIDTEHPCEIHFYRDNDIEDNEIDKEEVYRKLSAYFQVTITQIQMLYSISCGDCICITFQED